MPLATIIGMMNQFLLFPALAFGTAYFFSLPSALAVGMVILSASSSGTTSNLFTFLARGDTALSISLTAISKLLFILTLPVYIHLALQTFISAGKPISLAFNEIILSWFLVIVLPTISGMMIRARFPVFADQSRNPVKFLALLFLTVLVVGLAVKERALILSMIMQVGPAVLSLCLLS